MDPSVVHLAALPDMPPTDVRVKKSRVLMLTVLRDTEPRKCGTLAVHAVRLASPPHVVK
jgi:hypothetical protein